MRPATLMLCLLFALVAACGGQGSSATGPQAPTGQGGQPQATPTPPPAGGSGMSVAHLEVQGGKLAGTYDATGSKGDCNWAADGSAADYLDLTKTQGLTGLTFVTVTRQSPAMFSFLAAFGAFSLHQDTLEINTVARTVLGSGTTQLDDKGATIKWTVDGKTADGVTMKGSIECGPVDRR